MSHIRVLICQVDEPSSDQMTELAAFDLPAPDIATLRPIIALDDLETVTHETGHAILRRVLQAQWDIIDAALVAQHRQDALPHSVIADGHEPVTVASRFTQRVPALQLSGQVCQHTGLQTHALSGNAVLPLHHGIIITRGLHLLGLLATSGTPFRLCRSLARLANPRDPSAWGDDPAQPLLTLPLLPAPLGAA